MSRDHEYLRRERRVWGVRDHPHVMIYLESQSRYEMNIVQEVRDV